MEMRCIYSDRWVKTEKVEGGVWVVGGGGMGWWRGGGDVGWRVCGWKLGWL